MFRLILLMSMGFSGAVWSQAVGGGGSGGGGLTKSKIGPGCENGRRQVVTESITGSDRSQTVSRTCTNGSYYDLSNYIYDPKPRCQKKREGDVETWSVLDTNGNPMQIFKICKEGYWRNYKR